MQGTWTTLQCDGVPSARHENCFVNCNGKFYLLGGRRDQPTNEFDPLDCKWRTLSAPPIEIHHFQAINVGKKIWVVGAMTGPYPNEVPLKCVLIYDPASDCWTEGPEIPSHRRRGAGGTVFHQGKIYWVGGIRFGHDHGTINWFDCLDIETGSWVELRDAPIARDHFPAIVANDCLYCIGGRNTSVHTKDNFDAFFSAIIKPVDYYSFAESKWLRLENDLPIGTAAGSISLVNDSILYIGGESGAAPAHRDVQALDLKSSTWSHLMPMNTGRHGTQAITYRESIYIASGSGNRGGGPELETVERFVF